MFRLIRFCGYIAVGWLTVHSLPDLARYLRMSAQ